MHYFSINKRFCIEKYNLTSFKNLSNYLIRDFITNGQFKIDQMYRKIAL